MRPTRQWLMAAAALALALALALGSGCSKEKAAPQNRLPAADDWQAPSPMASQLAGGGMSGDDPHAGMDMSGMSGDDPHAGMDMSGTSGDDPHAGMDMSDPAMAGIEAPDPDRAIDESKFLAGTIVATDAVRSHVSSGAIMFLSVKPINPVTGEIMGGPVAVARIDVDKLPVGFRLTERNAMSAGTQLAGDVVIEARIDGDGEARSRNPGDVTGQVRAKVPADGLTLTLDKVL